MKAGIINRIVGIFFCIIIIFSNMKIYVEAKDISDKPTNLYAQSAVLMDADSGRILFGKNEDIVLPMASTTKIMTCILALENMEEGQKCMVSEYAADQPKVHLGMKKGERYYLFDLLHSLMLESHNDSAVVIAETISGSVGDFADMMNKKAVEIGCTNTYFITPNGLDAKNEAGIHSTTASDLARIMRYCIGQSPQKEAFLNITQKRNYEFSDVSGKRKFTCRNHNAFLDMMDGALSGKTGFTNAAGYCYVGALCEGSRTFIVALLAFGWPNNKGYKWEDTKKLMNYGIENYEYRNVWVKESTRPIVVENGFDPKHPFEENIYLKTRMNDEEQSLFVLLREDEKIIKKYIYHEKILAPVEEQKIAGKVLYIIDGITVGSYDIVTDDFIQERTIWNYLYILEKMYFL